MDAWPPDGLEQTGRCPVCGAAGRALLHDGLHDRLFGAPGTWTMWRCAQCGCGYLDPRPTQATIGLAYADYFWHEAPRSVIATTAKQRLRLALRNDVLNRRLGYDLPSVPLGAPLAHTAFGPALDRWARHLRPPGPQPTLLDVGCANGEFLIQIQALGWRATGIDVDDAALARAREAGLDVAHATLTEPGALAGRRFDAITLSHVIEHLHDPPAALRGAYELLAPGGTLWIATPNLRSLAYRAFRSDWLSLDPPRHLVVFTPDALRTAVANAGFTAILTPRPVRNARSIFSDSARAPLTPAQHARARLAERIWERRPDVAEELVVLATRPA